MTNHAHQDKSRSYSFDGIHVEEYPLCLVDLDETEASNSIPLREEFPAPLRTRDDNEYRAIALCAVLAVDLIAIMALGALIYFF